MKYYYILLGFIFLISCDNKFNKNEEATEIFKKTIGENLTISLDSVIKEVDKSLVKHFNKETEVEAYTAFLTFLIENDRRDSTFDLDLSLDEINRLNKLYEINDLRKEIWVVGKKDSLNLLKINMNGKYMRAMQKIDSIDCVANGYYTTYYYSGAPSYGQMSHYFFEDEVPLDDYLTKVMIVADFFYLALQVTAYNK